MISITDLLLENFTVICLAVGLGIIILTNKSLDAHTNHSFALFVLLVLILDLADITDLYLSKLPQLSPLRYVSSIIGYTVRPASLVVIIGILLRHKKMGFVLWIPIILVALVAITSPFTHIMFWFGSHNQFNRGPLGYLAHIVSGVYMALLIFLTIKMHRHFTSSEIFVVLYIAVVCVGATTLESLLSGHKFLLTGAMISSCALYYIIIYVETYKRDSLTGLINRQSFYYDIARLKNKPMAVISADLNGLKDINDNHGHSAGDKALLNMGNAMLAKSGKGFTAYRVGGDEFMALGKEQTAEAVDKYIADIRAALEEDGMTASFGVAFYSVGDNFDEVCNRADAKMYEDKKHYKHRTIGNAETDGNTKK